MILYIRGTSYRYRILLQLRNLIRVPDNEVNLKPFGLVLPTTMIGRESARSVLAHVFPVRPARPP